VRSASVPMDKTKPRADGGVLMWGTGRVVAARFLLQDRDTSRDALTLLRPALPGACSAPACSAGTCRWPVADGRWLRLAALPCSHLLSPWPDCPGLGGWPWVKESTLLCLTRRFAHPVREQPAQPWIVFRFLLPSGRSTGKVFM